MNTSITKKLEMTEPLQMLSQLLTRQSKLYFWESIFKPILQAVWFLALFLIPTPKPSAKPWPVIAQRIIHTWVFFQSSLFHHLALHHCWSSVSHAALQPHTCNELSILTVAVLTVTTAVTRTQFKALSLVVSLQWIRRLFLICSHRADSDKAGI